MLNIQKFQFNAIRIGSAREKYIAVDELKNEF